MSNQALTKEDLQNAVKDAVHELKDFIRERELITMRWVIGIQITYFFGTLASVWLLVTHHLKS